MEERSKPTRRQVEQNNHHRPNRPTITAPTRGLVFNLDGVHIAKFSRQQQKVLSNNLATETMLVVERKASPDRLHAFKDFDM